MIRDAIFGCASELAATRMKGARPLATMLWQIGLTPKHWRYEVWINGARCVDAIAVRVDRRAIVMRFRDGTYERDGLDRIKADLGDGAGRGAASSRASAAA